MYVSTWLSRSIAFSRSINNAIASGINRFFDWRFHQTRAINIPAIATQPIEAIMVRPSLELVLTCQADGSHVGGFSSHFSVDALSHIRELLADRQYPPNSLHQRQSRSVRHVSHQKYPAHVVHF
eukprot:c19555_g1_i3.p2 GENE.c19555_g1_i3~~c19555_g1_i3.p2  ORF type:complete len:124 (-),score=9.21 c19555_g1_i3:648-1019(-)